MKDKKRIIKLRICATCQRVYWWKSDKIYHAGYYSAIWALGWRKAIWYWLTGKRRRLEDADEQK